MRDLEALRNALFDAAQSAVLARAPIGIIDDLIVAAGRVGEARDPKDQPHAGATDPAVAAIALAETALSAWDRYRGGADSNGG